MNRKGGNTYILSNAIVSATDVSQLGDVSHAFTHAPYSLEELLNHCYCRDNVVNVMPLPLYTLLAKRMQLEVV